MTAIEKLLKTAEAEVGYLEKKSNTDLDSKTGNAGYANYTKYGRDMDAVSGFFNGRKNGYDWCAVFVCWCFVKTFGAEKALELLFLPKKNGAAGCTYASAKYFSAGRLMKNPRPGDQIFFGSSKSRYHTGLVYKVDDRYVYTVEGNTNGADGVVANGGGVFLKRYSRNNGSIYGYGRPAYEILPQEEDAPAKNTTVKASVWMRKDTQGRILDLGLGVDRGSLWYQVHTLNGRWLPKVTGFDPSDYFNGYAGNHTPIDAVRVYYMTPKGEPYKQARYAVQTEKSGERRLPEQVDNSTADGMDGYAGNFGEAITGFEWRVDSK